MRKLIGLILLLLFITSCREAHHGFNGYIDADLTYLSSDFAGRLTSLWVGRGQAVQKNQPLFRLEQTSELYGVESSQYATGNLLSQKAGILSKLAYSKTNYRRVLKMRKENAASQNDLDLAKQDLDVLETQLAGINDSIAKNRKDTSQKKWELLRKEGFALEPGIVFDTYHTENEYIPTGQPVLSLITQNNIKIVFFIPEKMLSEIHLNQKIEFSLGRRSKTQTGKITYISRIAEYTPPIIFSREEREKLVFRAEAKLDNPNLNEIHLGQPISLETTE